MAASASSLVLPSITNPKILALCNPNYTSLSVLSVASSSIKLQVKPISVYSSFSLKRGSEKLAPRFVRKVAISSEFEQDEEVLSDEDEPSFAPDLKLFVGNLPFTVDSAQLAGLFESVGNVEMVEVIYDKITGRSRGFGFVTMSTSAEVEAAEEKFNGYELDGRPLRVNAGPPPPKGESPFRGSRGGGFDGGNRGGGDFNSGNRLYVGNLSWGVDDSALENLFSELGQVVEAKVVYDRESGRSRGFGFVTYSSAKEVDSAIESLNGADLNGRPIRVTVAESRPRRQF